MTLLMGRFYILFNFVHSFLYWLLTFISSLTLLLTSLVSTKYDMFDAEYPKYPESLGFFAINDLNSSR